MVEEKDLTEWPAFEVFVVRNNSFAVTTLVDSIWMNCSDAVEQKEGLGENWEVTPMAVYKEKEVAKHKETKEERPNSD